MSEDSDEKPVNPYAVTSKIFARDYKPSRADKKLAEKFLERLKVHGGQAAVDNFMQYVRECGEQEKLPLPREDVKYLSYSGGAVSSPTYDKGTKLSEAQIFAEAIEQFQEDRKDRRLFLRLSGGFVAASVLAGLAIPPAVEYMHSDQVSKETRENVGAAMLGTACIGGSGLLVVAGVLGALLFMDREKKDPELKSLEKSDDTNSFASRIKDIKKERER